MPENENAIAISYKSEYLVFQANELVRSKQDDLSLLEAKIIRLAIAQVLENDTDFRTYSCNVVELAKFLGMHKQNVYKEFQDISASLLKKSIFIMEKEPKKNGQPNYKGFHWVDDVEYKDGILTFRLSEKLKPYLIGLEELFTVYSYEAIVALPTNYSIRLYELIASWQNSTIRNVPMTNYADVPIYKNEFIFTTGYLREYFNCVNKYPNTGDFVINVIKKAVTDIQKNTIMRVSYRTVKEGRSIRYIIFKLRDWGESDSEWKEKMKRIESLERKSKDINTED